MGFAFGDTPKAGRWLWRPFATLMGTASLGLSFGELGVVYRYLHVVFLCPCTPALIGFYLYPPSRGTPAAREAFVFIFAAAQLGRRSTCLVRQSRCLHALSRFCRLEPLLHNCVTTCTRAPTGSTFGREVLLRPPVPCVLFNLFGAPPPLCLAGLGLSLLCTGLPGLGLFALCVLLNPPPRRFNVVHGREVLLRPPEPCVVQLVWCPCPPVQRG